MCLACVTGHPKQTCVSIKVYNITQKYSHITHEILYEPVGYETWIFRRVPESLDMELNEMCRQTSVHQTFSFYNSIRQISSVLGGIGRPLFQWYSKSNLFVHILPKVRSNPPRPFPQWWGLDGICYCYWGVRASLRAPRLILGFSITPSTKVIKAGAKPHMNFPQRSW